MPVLVIKFNVRTLSSRKSLMDQCFLLFFLFFNNSVILTKSRQKHKPAANFALNTLPVSSIGNWCFCHWTFVSWESQFLSVVKEFTNWLVFHLYIIIRKKYGKRTARCPWMVNIEYKHYFFKVVLLGKGSHIAAKVPSIALKYCYSY